MAYEISESLGSRLEGEDLAGTLANINEEWAYKQLLKLATWDEYAIDALTDLPPSMYEKARKVLFRRLTKPIIQNYAEWILDTLREIGDVNTLKCILDDSTFLHVESNWGTANYNKKRLDSYRFSTVHSIHQRLKPKGYNPPVKRLTA